MYETILYCDGTSDKLTPQDYSVQNGDVINAPLNSMSRIYKHCVNVVEDIHMEGLTIEVNDCKYCVHLDRAGKHSAKFINCRFVAKENVQQPIGMGIQDGQEFIFERCEFLSPIDNQVGIYCHNWNNESEPTLLSIKDSHFTNGYLVLGELGSEQNSFVNINNCFSDTDNPGIKLGVEKDSEGKSYWKNPETGQGVSDLSQVPYNFHVNFVGTYVGEINLVDRPNGMKYFVGKLKS